MLAGSLVGKQIGNYVATQLIGQGGMAEIYLAEHPKIGRQVAIKVLGAHLSHHLEASARFLVEARAITRIVHPNVVDIYDFGSLEDGRCYCMMEVLKGRELGEVMAEAGKMTCQEVQPYLEQICGGLQTAHDLGVIHRDLKPENIFVLAQQPMRLKLLDFGIAKMLGDGDAWRTNTGKVLGTPLFLAPEQAAGQPERVGRHSDLYSLGVILYCMLAGRPPFSDQITSLLLAKHITEPPPPIQEIEPSVPDAIAELIDQCLEKEPAARPESAEAIAQRFAAGLAASGRAQLEPKGVLGGEIPAEEVEAARIGPPVAKTLLAAGGAVVLAVALGVLLLRGGQENAAVEVPRAATAPRSSSKQAVFSAAPVVGDELPAVQQCAAGEPAPKPAAPPVAAAPAGPGRQAAVGAPAAAKGRAGKLTTKPPAKVAAEKKPAPLRRRVGEGTMRW